MLYKQNKAARCNYFHKLLSKLKSDSRKNYCHRKELKGKIKNRRKAAFL